jgi:hypothetical protein
MFPRYTAVIADKLSILCEKKQDTLRKLRYKVEFINKP